MWIFKRKNNLQRYIQKKTAEGLSIGFVPTMGALHPGHISLVEASRNTCGITVCSIFVNPTQFNDKKDLENYPRTVEKDIQMLFDAGCDAVFLPSVEEIYPTLTTRHYDLGTLEQVFEGSSRPGHFQGVCQVVDRLLDTVQPTDVFFGQKDYQQCMVINKLLALSSNLSNIKMHISPTQREANGLAMSSRNLRLNQKEQAIAPEIFQALQYLKKNLQAGSQSKMLAQARDRLVAVGFKPDYVSIAHAKTLEEMQVWDGEAPLVALVAAFLGEVRLIDNLILTD